MRILSSLYIGGPVTKSQHQEILQRVGYETGVKFERRDKYLRIDFTQIIVEHKRAESFCKENKIAYKKETAAFDEFSESVYFYIPQLGIDEYYELNQSGNVVLEASDLMDLQEALKRIDLKNSPTFINSHLEMNKEYAMHLLSGGTPLEFVMKVLGRVVPPPIPELPAFRIVKDPPTPKLKGKNVRLS